MPDTTPTIRDKVDHNEAVIRRHEERISTTERVAVEAASRLRAFVERAHTAYIAIDKNSIVREWNAAASRMFGFSRDEALGREMTFLIIPPELRDAHRAGVRRFLHKGDGRIVCQSVRMPAITKDKRPLTISLTVTSWEVDDPDAPCFGAFIEDETETAQLQEIIKEYEKEKQLMKIKSSLWGGLSGLIIVVIDKVLAHLHLL